MTQMYARPHEELEQRIRRHHRELEAAGLKRRLQAPCGIDLSSNDYLGLATHPLVKQRMAEAVWAEGCGAQASRLLRGHRNCFDGIERRFADLKQAEAALFFGSGYAANLSVLSSFAGRSDFIFCDEQNHASLIDGITLSHARRVKFPHCDVDRVARLLKEASGPAQKFLVTESLFSMDGDIAPLAQYAELCRDTGTVLIVDEAHAVGIYGSRGSGLVEQTGISDAVFLTINTAGKALGAAGALVAGPEWAIDHLIQTARPFIFSTAPPPSLAAALDAALTVNNEEPQRRQRLLVKAELLRNLLIGAGAAIGKSSSQIIPVMLGANELACSVAEELQHEGFDVRAIRPPSVAAGTARLRVSLNSELDEDTIRRFALTIGRILSKVTPCSAASS